MCKIVAFTGPSYSGRTTIILNTALILSKTEKVVIIDADQTKGNLASALNFDHLKTGLAEAATGLLNSSIINAVVKGRKSKLSFITLPQTARANDLLSLTSRQAENFFAKVKEQFDYVLVDCGNFLNEALSATALIHADEVFLVSVPEKRGQIWANAYRSITESFDQSKLNFIISNLYEIPEISADDVFGCLPLEIPYIANMRDYSVSGEVYLNSSGGRRAGDYLKGINAVVERIRGVKHEL